MAIAPTGAPRPGFDPKGLRHRLGGRRVYIATPPAEVDVAQPLQQTVRLHLDQTGNAIAFATVDLIARVEGFLTDIKYQDGASAKKEDVLFIIEQPPYQAKLQQAEAALIAAKAELVKSEAELSRQSTLRSQDISTQVALDKARAQRDSDKANVMSQEAGVTLAKINLGYTSVAAPFDGIVTRHLVSVGELVGGTQKTKLATIVQLDPIYVTFNMSEQDLLRIRANLDGRRLTLAELQMIPIEVGLMTDQGFPLTGKLDYVSPELDPATGTILVRGIFSNPDRILLPGLFVRIRIPTGRVEENALLVPDRALGQNQEGRYLLVLDKNDVVEQRKVQIGQQFGELRLIQSGLKPDDRVVVAGIQRAIPGRKVAPQTTTIASIAPAPAAAK
ncbi:MAG: efflux RND transporter periplasmic adaptor subunit [Rhodoplanes sp.]